jgi:hypothetical protein
MGKILRGKKVQKTSPLYEHLELLDILHYCHFIPNLDINFAFMKKIPPTTMDSHTVIFSASLRKCPIRKGNFRTS